MGGAGSEQISELRVRIERTRQAIYRSEARLEELERQREELRQEAAEPAAEAARLQAVLDRLQAEAAELLGLETPASLPQMKARLTQARALLSQRIGQKQRVMQDLAACRQQGDKAREEASVFERVALLLQQTADHARRQAKEQIEALVTATLRSVFGPDYAFAIELAERAGRPEAEFYVVSSVGGEPLRTRLQDSRGGGVVDIVSLGLRMAMLETYRPKLEGALILDEPAKHVSDEFIQPTALFFQQVSQGFGRQVIMVTHDAHLAETAQVAYQVVLKGDRSLVTRAAGIEGGNRS